MSLAESHLEHCRYTTKGSLMADRDNEKDGPEDKESEEESRTGDEQAAINRENDPPA